MGCLQCRKRPRKLRRPGMMEGTGWGKALLKEHKPRMAPCLLTISPGLGLSHELLRLEIMPGQESLRMN